MVKKQFGQTDLFTAPLIFGGNVFGWTLNQDASFRILDEFIDRGFNMIDTSNNYPRWVPTATGLESETIIGNWIQRTGKRSDYIIATKVGGKTKTRNTANVSQAEIIREVEFSLKRLKTDYIDLYQIHYDNEETPVSETMEALNRLVQDGKVRYIGTSNMSAARIRSSIDYAAQQQIASYQSIQPLYNLYERDLFEKNYQALALEKKLAVTPYYSLASGFLTGKYRNNPEAKNTERGKTLDKYFSPKADLLLSNIERVAHNHQVSMAAVSLAWLLQQAAITAPIASATQSQHLDAFTEAASLKLNSLEIKLLNL